MKELAEQGAVGFTDDGIPIMDVELVRRAMEEAVALDMPISFHEEDPAYITNTGITRGKASEFFGIGGSPREAEITLDKEELALAEWFERENIPTKPEDFSLTNEMMMAFKNGLV